MLSIELELNVLFEFRIMPWGCASGFLRRIVPDATPQHNLAQGSPSVSKTDLMNLKMNNNNTAAKESMLIQRMTAGTIGERVL
jgi:hypothetical protein